MSAATATVVDVIRLTLTGTNQDGEWFRVSRDGWLIGRVRTCRELARLVDLADLREALGISRANRLPWNGSPALKHRAPELFAELAWRVRCGS